jgi:hypothetical protein
LAKLTRSWAGRKRIAAGLEKGSIHPELDTMMTRTSLADRLFGPKFKARFKNTAYSKRRRASRQWQGPTQFSLLEERCMLSAVITSGIALPTPTGGFVQPSAVMYQTTTASTSKMITITNNTNKTLFPFIEDSNTGVNPQLNQLYDPNDYPYVPASNGQTVGQEYRLYVGYQKVVDGKTQNFLGLPAQSSITVTIPMVFWNAGTIQVVGDTPDVRARFLSPLEPGGNALGRPFLYNVKDAKEAVVTADLTGPGAKTGMMLLYHTTNPQSQGVIPDAPSQLLEFTIRDASMPTGDPNDPNFSNNVDYDISYINAVYSPVAMEAMKPGVGYVGTLDNTNQYQAKVRAFENGSILNGYFGGKGWPYYYVSNPVNPVAKGSLNKLVGAQNIFSDNTAASSYNLLHTMLSSSAGTKASGGVLKPSNGDYAELDLANYWFGWLNYYATSWNQPIDPKLLQIENNGGLKLNPVTITPDPNLTWTLATAGQTASDADFAHWFSYTVYQVMDAFSKDGNIVFNDPSQPAVRTFMHDIIGNTISDIVSDKTPAGVLLTQEEIALLQGEPNTGSQALSQTVNQPNYSLPNGPDGHYDSYPTPAGPSDAAGWGVGKYNLDPQVWFVHQYLGAYSYAFSVDDSYGNVQVDNSSGINIAIGGSNGIPNTTPFQNGE